VDLPIGRLVQVIARADRVEVAGFEASEQDASIDLHLLIEGSPLHCRLLDVRVSKDDWGVLQMRLESKRSAREPEPDTSAGDPTVAYLADHGLPHYWNRLWLEERLEECGTYAAVARTYPESVCHVGGTTIANYARGVFGWRKRARVSARRADVVRTVERDGPDAWTQSRLAKRFGVSVSTINRWLRDATHAYEALMTLTHQPRSESEVERFAEEHTLTGDVVRGWLVDGTKAFDTTQRQLQAKNHYYTVDVYNEKRDAVRAAYQQAGRRLNKSALARQLGVDRSTVARWVRELSGA
jgi:transcriptional regulator with XRE-family HTH domain